MCSSETKPQPARPILIFAILGCLQWLSLNWEAARP